MYHFKIKAEAADIELPAVRSLLGFALILSLLYKNQHNHYINIAVASVLFAALFFSATLLLRFRINILIITGVTAILVFVATHAIIFSLIIFILAVLIKQLYVQPQASFHDHEIKIKKTFVSKIYQWDNFNNVVLKDNLLTLDFKNNRVLQLETENASAIDEEQFNDYCAKKLMQ